jgi:hypothetical protein
VITYKINFLNFRCHSGKGRLAGIGRDCRKVVYTRPSCLSHGRIDVYRSRDKVPRDKSCAYQEGITSGVLCCKKHKRRRKMKNGNLQEFDL